MGLGLAGLALTCPAAKTEVRKISSSLNDLGPPPYATQLFP